MAVGDEGADSDTVVLTGFDALNQVVDSVGFTADAGQVLSISGAGITHFTLDVQAGSVLFDNVTFEFENAQIPEPGALALLGLGLVGLGFARRKMAA